jgi:hypothetical protein
MFITVGDYSQHLMEIMKMNGESNHLPCLTKVQYGSLQKCHQNNLE